MSAITAIDDAVTQISDIEAPSSPAVPTLSGDLQTLHTTAQTWPSAVRAQVMGYLGNCSSHASAYASTTAPQLGQLVASKDPGATARFLALLNATQSVVVDLQGQATPVTAAVNSFRSGQLAASSRVTADAQTASSVLQGEQAQAVALEAEIEALQRKIEKDREYEQLGWLLGPLGAIIAREIGDLVDDVAGKEAQIQSEEQQIATLNADVQALIAVTGALNVLVPANGVVIAGLTALTNGLAVLGGELANLLQAVASAGSVDPTWVKAELDRLAGGWTDVASAATALTN
ncbi:MAG TPA: HBL/NHE enterotoxin family protein [Thermoleophilaceae bacterium]|nr:HBL/NHE enterotoxin family protein [Thermoleophilaceae bacterium]